ncbi:cold-shock protein [Pseudomonas trivialis]|uniref:CSD domain-containing protein n=1 Tax=Pseudomonas trivialis TaxID=200450 RepID=A0A0H5ACJ8_9PSED|nr:cold shock domain-containing protein [Pseudomonas trivialis]AKS08824.1 hypothetical protein AA957_22715 [Pseudomonas trivialis]
MATGIVSVSDTNKLFAVITPEGGGSDVTVYEPELRAAGLTDLKKGDKVNFDLAPGGQVQRIKRA